MYTLNPSSLLCALWMLPSPFPYPATLLTLKIYIYQQDLINVPHKEVDCLQWIFMTAKSSDGVKILKLATGSYPFSIFHPLSLFLIPVDILLLKCKVSSCLASRTLSIACHGYRVSWLFHQCFSCIYFSRLLIAFSEYLCSFSGSTFVFSLTSVKVLNKPSHWVGVFWFSLLYFSVLCWEGL